MARPVHLGEDGRADGPRQTARPSCHGLPGTGSSGDCGADRDGLPGRPRGLNLLSVSNLNFGAPIGHALPGTGSSGDRGAGRDGLPGRPQGLNFLSTPNLNFGAPIGHALPGTGSSGDCGAGRDGLPGRPRGLKFLSTPNLDFSAPIGHALPENLQRRQSRSGVSPLSPHLNDQLCTPVREPLSKRSV